MPTSQHPLTQLDFSERVAKRAQYEAFEFTIVPEGVRVRNGSYADPVNREYVMRVSAGVPTECTCPADSDAEAACKHRVAVAIRDPVIEAAITHVRQTAARTSWTWRRAQTSTRRSALTAVTRSRVGGVWSVFEQRELPD